VIRGDQRQRMRSHILESRRCRRSWASQRIHATCTRVRRPLRVLRDLMKTWMRATVALVNCPDAQERHRCGTCSVVHCPRSEVKSSFNPRLAITGVLIASAGIGLLSARGPQLCLIMALFATLVVALAVRPNWVIYAAVGSSIVPWNVELPSTGLSIAPAALVAPLLLAVAVADRARSGARVSLGKSGVFGLVIFAVAAVSLPKTAEPKWSAVDVWLLTVAPLCIYLALLNEPRSRWETVGKVVVSVAGGMAAVGLLGVSLLPQLQAVTLAADGTSGAVRVASYANPNAVAMLMNLAWPLAVAYAATSSGVRRVWWTGLTLLLIGALLLTYSRGGWASAAVMLALLTLAASRGAMRVGGLLAGLSVASLILFVPDLSGRLALGLSSDDPSAVSRGMLWSAALAMSSKDPLLGVGFGPFNYANYLNPLYVSGLAVASSHNVYLDALIFTGVVGLGAYLALLARAFAATFSQHEEGRSREGQVRLAVRVILAGWILHGFVDVTYFSFVRVVPFWAILAILDSGSAGTVARGWRRWLLA